MFRGKKDGVNDDRTEDTSVSIIVDSLSQFPRQLTRVFVMTVPLRQNEVVTTVVGAGQHATGRVETRFFVLLKIAGRDAPQLLRNTSVYKRITTR
jgi:hypothetical protein